MGLMNDGIYELEPTLTGIYVAKNQERTNTELDDSMN